jgi:putative tryptophan/tyrosine transport system substrate-binding protein
MFNTAGQPYTSPVSGACLGRGAKLVLDCVSTVDRLVEVPALARELVSRRPGVLIAGPVSFLRALEQETTTIPIVMPGTLEPVGSGF